MLKADFWIEEVDLDPSATFGVERSRAVCVACPGVAWGSPLSVLGWVLTGAAAWLLLSVIIGLVFGRVMRWNSPTTLDVLRGHHRHEVDSLTVPEIQETEAGVSGGEPVDGDLPARRPSARDEAEVAERHRQSE